MTNDARNAWQLGYVLMMLPVFIGMVLALTDPPTWLQITGVVVILVLVFVGSRLMFRKRGGWRPSDTLPPR